MKEDDIIYLIILSVVILIIIFFIRVINLSKRTYSRHVPSEEDIEDYYAQNDPSYQENDDDILAKDEYDEDGIPYEETLDKRIEEIEQAKEDDYMATALGDEWDYLKYYDYLLPKSGISKLHDEDQEKNKEKEKD